MAVACPDPRVSVDSRWEEDVVEVCLAADRAIRFLASHGVALQEPIRVHLVDRVESEHDRAALGAFDSRQRRIEILSLERFLARPGTVAFSEPASQELHSSLIVHEVAHAVAQSNFSPARPPAVCQEYIAYVVQLSTMAAGMRERILARFDAAGFGRDEEICQTVYLISPDVFAAKAYRHFTRDGNGARIIRRMLEGAFRPTDGD